MKSIKSRVERLEREIVPATKEPLVILFRVLTPGNTSPLELEPLELCAGYGGGLVVDRRPGESLDELIARARLEHPQQPFWTGWYRPAEENKAIKEAGPISAPLSSPQSGTA